MSLRDLYVSECSRIGCKCNTAIVKSLPATSTLTISIIDLNNNFVGAKGLRAIVAMAAKCPELRQLLVADNYLTNESVVEMCDILDPLTKLEVLDLSNNPISHVAGKRLSLFVSRHPSMHIVKLQNTLINPALVKIITSKCCGVSTIRAAAAQSIEENFTAAAPDETTSPLPYHRPPPASTNTVAYPGVSMLREIIFDPNLSDPREFYGLQILHYLSNPDGEFPLAALTTNPKEDLVVTPMTSPVIEARVIPAIPPPPPPPPCTATRDNALACLSKVITAVESVHSGDMSEYPSLRMLWDLSALIVTTKEECLLEEEDNNNYPGLRSLLQVPVSPRLPHGHDEEDRTGALKEVLLAPYLGIATLLEVAHEMNTQEGGNQFVMMTTPSSSPTATGALREILEACL
jgi:hypothetical protein